MFPPSPRFIRGLQANLRYWLEQTAVLDDDAIARLDPEFPNVLRAVEMGLVLAEIRQDTAVLILQCFFWVEGAGHVHQWRLLVEKCLDVMPAADDWLRFRLLKQAGQFQRLEGDGNTAVTTFRQAKKLARRLNDSQAIAEIHMNLSQVYYRQHRYDMAESEGQAANALFTKAQPRLKFITLQILGQIASARQEWGLAESYFNQALSLPDGGGLRVTDRIRTMNHLALVCQEQKAYEQAWEIRREIARLLAGSAPVKDRIDAQINLGVLFYDWGRLAQAETAFRQAEQMLRTQPGFTQLKALVANNLGCVLRDRQEWLSAHNYFGRSLNLYAFLNDTLMQAKANGNLAKCYMRREQWLEARHYFGEALTLLDSFLDTGEAAALRKQYADQKKTLPI